MGNLCGKKAKENPAYSGGAQPVQAKQKQPAASQPTNTQPASQPVTSPNTKQKEAVIEQKGRQPEDEVTTQDELKAQEFRKQADQHAKARGQYYDQSQQAFKSGDKAGAKELSEKGKKEQALMEEANRKAADLIFQSKNRNQPADSIDLHLLLVTEAVERTEQRLEQCQKRKDNHLIIIYGAGHHSKDNKQMIKPAVLKLLNEKGLKYTENSPNIGCATVQF